MKIIKGFILPNCAPKRIIQTTCSFTCTMEIRGGKEPSKETKVSRGCHQVAALEGIWNFLNVEVT